MNTTTDNLRLSVTDKMELLQWAMQNMRLSHQVTIARILRRKSITWTQIDRVFSRLLDVTCETMDYMLSVVKSAAKSITRKVSRYVIPVMSSLGVMTNYLTKVLANHPHRQIHSIKYLPNQWVVQFM